MGTNGTNGVDGIGIKAIAFNEDGELLITLTNDEVVNCGKVPTCEHIFSDWSVVVAPNCTSMGASVRTCSKCGFEDYDFTTALGHTFTETVVDPTCHLGGYTKYTCSVCNMFYIDNYTDATDEHTYTDLYALESTCSVRRVLKSCEVCNKTVVEEVEPTVEHNFVDSICTVCGATYGSKGLAYTLSADGLSYSVTGIGTCTDKDIVIPVAYEGLPVTKIGKSAFQGCGHSLSAPALPSLHFQMV